MFRLDDPATEMFYVLDGRFRLTEAQIEIGSGQVVGEIGLVSEGNRRTQTLVCEEDGEMLSLAYEEVRQLYAQNPEFGFYFLRLVSARMLANVRAAEAKVARLTGAGGCSGEVVPDTPAMA